MGASHAFKKLILLAERIQLRISFIPSILS